MSSSSGKIINFPVRDLPPLSTPAQPGKVLQKNKLTQAKREQELRENAARCFADELARSQARLGRLLLDGETGRRKVQAAEEEVVYYRRMLADVTPADEREERIDALRANRQDA